MIVDLVVFSKQLRDTLIADAQIKGVVAERVYNTRLPQHNIFPAITFQIVSIDAVEVKENASDYDIVRVQINCYDSGFSSVEKTAGYVRRTLDRLTDNSNQSVEIHQTFFINRNSSVFDETQKIYWVSLDFDFHLKVKL